MTDPTLYEWLEQQIASEDVVGHTRYASLSLIVQNLGVLLGIGHSKADVLAFVERSLEDGERMMALVREGSTPGEALDALSSLAPQLELIEGGRKDAPS